MIKNSLYTLIMKASKSFFCGILVLLLAAACTKQPKSSEQQTDVEQQTKANQQTMIELIGDDASYNMGEIQVGSPNLRGKEWLIQNIGNANLKIDSVEVSCDCLQILYDSVNVVAPNNYFPFRVFVKPENVLGDFYREIRIFGNFEGSPLELTLEGTIVASNSIRE